MPSNESDFEENQDNQASKEILRNLDFGMGYDYKSEGPITYRIHKNEPKQEENDPPLLNDNGALPSEWRGLFFMFQDDSIKEESSKIVGNSNDSDEDASFSHAADNGFFFMFEHSSP